MSILSEQHARFLFDGLRNSSVRELAIKNCSIERNLPHLATALTHSHLRELEFISSAFQRTVPFWTALGAGETPFRHLERFKCSFDCSSHREMPDIIRVQDEAFPMACPRLAQCPRLKHIELFVHLYVESLDRAVADCVRNCSCLTTISIVFLRRGMSHRLGAANGYSAPFLLETLLASSNYKIQVSFSPFGRLCSCACGLDESGYREDLSRGVKTEPVGP